MSFKREGDDSSQLNILKKRRVADLLSNFIPEDEAALMKNGRYTCLVCSYRPVFDTVDMLTVHRKGKRHLEGLKWFYGKKTTLHNEIEKRRHQNYVQAEEGKQNLSQEEGKAAPLLTQTRNITHHALLKSIPYSSCHKKISLKFEKGSTSSGLHCQTVIPPTNKSSPLNQISCPEVVGAVIKETRSVPSYCSSTKGHQTHPQALKKQEAVKKKSRPTITLDPEPISAERRRELDHYLKLKSSGWLQDRSGGWVKDENVEFDSDEDQPSPLPPLPHNTESTDVPEQDQRSPMTPHPKSTEPAFSQPGSLPEDRCKR
ncbi:sodium channel modifier 1 [Conger conger]|uniref:sodium channel modifier 1 n=1 Tax=Conger conger TaxID=82655 RepID=UPI002A59B49F|nr:sodium channel modifier 1 [Conger conger]